MPVESPEERTVEVLALPPEVDEELLSLYFENRRRSGGGPLVSVHKQDDRAVLVFEQAEAAAQVLSKGHHVVHNVEMTVRKPASKDRRRLLLVGVDPSTDNDMIELYVENLMGLDDDNDYTLYPSPGRDLVLIQLSQPLSKDFQTLSDKISKRSLGGAKVTLEQVDQTDSILVEKLKPGTDVDLLTLYFESKDSGNLEVKAVTKLSESAAKVSFTQYQSVESVLDLPHKLGGAELVVTPYYDFLQPTQTLAAQDSGAESQEMSERDSEDLSDMQVQGSLPNAEEAPGQPSSMSTPPDLAMEAQMEEEVEETLSDVIPVGDKMKLAVFELSSFQQATERSHPGVAVQIRDTAIQVTASDRQTLDLAGRSVREFVDKMAEVDFAVEPEKAELFASRDVKERLLQALIETGSAPAMYTVSDGRVAVTSLCRDSAGRACSFLQAQLSSFSLAVEPQHESIFYCREWLEFLRALGFSSVRVSEQGGSVDVWTLKGMEDEVQAAILTFISTPIERETIVPMEPGVLKYIQTYQHELLVEMDQVSIFPLEGPDLCGLKIYGHATACQMAEEVLQSVAASVCTQTITVNAPGVTRYFAEDECQSLIKEMERRFLVHIVPKQVPWKPLPQQDIFITAWTMMSQKNFQRSATEEVNGAADAGLLEEAKKIVSSVEETLEQDASLSEPMEDVDQLDLYTAEEESNPRDLVASQPSNGLPPLANPSDLEEEAQLSLAIQYSMETSQWSQQDEDEQLQKALELSKRMSAGGAEVVQQQQQQQQQQKKKKNQADVSLQAAISSANTLQLRVFAGYDCDLSRVNIAFGKRVKQKQVEERLEHRTLRNMSEYHRNCVEMIKRKNAVDVQIQGTILTVSGFKDYVVGGLCDVKLLLEKMASSLSDREILRTVQWVHHDPASAATTPYSAEAIVFLENVWRMKVPHIDMLLDNQPHTINFEKMQEHNIVSGTSVKISRMLGDLDVEVPEEEYSMVSGLPERSKLDEGSDEFQNVVKSFYESIHEYHSKIRIIKVEKLMNRLLYNQYKLKKASVLQMATYPEIERTLYHGTSESSVKEICIHGFNRSFCGKNATVYGQGVYFAVDSSLSVQERYSPPNADGHKFIFVSKVLTGDYTKGCHSMKTAPLKETGDIPLRYDSVTDDINKPSMFVIFNDTQAFPEYLITCASMHPR